MNIPESLLYTNDHEYISVENNIATLGITDYAQSQLGDIIYVDITSNENDVITKGSVVGTIEAVKTVAEVFSPVSGKIVEINNSINDSPSVLNEDPYGKGWILKIEISDSDELKDLLSSNSYKELIGI